MSVQSVLDGICTYFGGAYDTTTHTYRSSPITGVGVVRRGWAKRDDHADYFRGMPPGTRTGCQIVVHISHQIEGRKALGGAHSGVKFIEYTVELLCFVRSNSGNAEDAQDDVHTLRDNLVAWMRADRTLGGAVFQAGEHVEHGNSFIEFSYGQPETKAELTKSFLSMRFTALEFVFA